VAVILASLAVLCVGSLEVDQEMGRRGARDLEAEGHQYGVLRKELVTCGGKLKVLPAARGPCMFP